MTIITPEERAEWRRHGIYRAKPLRGSDMKVLNFHSKDLHRLLDALEAAKAERDVLLKWITENKDCHYCPVFEACKGEPTSCFHEVVEWMRHEAQGGRE